MIVEARAQASKQESPRSSKQESPRSSKQAREPALKQASKQASKQVTLFNEGKNTLQSLTDKLVALP